ncbi:MAG TPA: hypothetical protein VN853_09465 [Polyangia bacterium]|nr:hypothetical protein [Polyangia bacterium]
MVFAEILDRTGRALASQGALWVVALAVAVWAAFPDPRLRRLWARPAVRWAGLGLVLILGALWAWSLVWASDDAYISFRYARNLARGHGLVFNVGERVEGYTDFLWTVLVAGLIRLGFAAGESAIIVSLLAFVALLVTVWRLAERKSPAGSPTLPVAAVLTAASYTVASFATSGLETVLAAAFVLAALAAAEADRPLTAGLLAVLAILCHPDHLLFYLALAGALALTARGWRTRAQVLLRYTAPFVLVLVPYFLWRWRYYGDPMPNTYYAKSGGLSYFSQGKVYLLVTFVTGGLWAAVPLALVGLWRLRGSVTGWFALLALPIYLAYVAKIGGDFMLGRLFVPVLPVMFLLVEVGLRVLLVSRSRRAARATALGLALLASIAALPVRAVGPGEIFHGIADERTFTTLDRFSPLATGAAGYHLGHALRAEFKAHGLSPKVAIFSIGMAGFYSDLPLYDLRGLTSRDVAHLPILGRGRPGHEKLASPGMVLGSGATLSEMDVYPPPYGALGQAVIDGFHLSVVRFEPSIAPTLVARAGVLDFRPYLDAKTASLAAAAATGDPARLACDLWHMRAYYFAANDDPARRRAVAEALAPADPGAAALWDGWLGGARGGFPAGWSKLRAHGATYGGWRASGDGAAWRVREVPANQTPPSGGRRGPPFVDSYTRAGADGSLGALVSPPFVLAGDAITLEVGGGLSPSEAHVDLLIDGQPVKTATGCDTDIWGARLWDTRALRGRTATLAVVDSGAGPWAHVEVDALDEWAVAALPAAAAR